MIQKTLINIRRYLIAFAFSGLVACSGGNGTTTAPSAVPAADMVLRNGLIYTVDSDSSQAEAVAIRDGVIVYVGTSIGVADMIGVDTKVIELDGRLVLPGLHDSHLHPLEAGSSVAGTCLVRNDRDLLDDSFKEDLVLCAPKQQGGINWVLGYGHSIFQLLDLPDGVTPASILDSAIPDKPAAFIEETSHSVWVNTAALKLAGIDRDTSNPVGGVIVKDEAGEPNGLLLDNAGDIVYELAFLPPTDALLDLHLQGLKFSLQLIAANGITSIANARVYTRRGYLDVWRRALEENALSVRTVLGLWAYPTLLEGETDADQIAQLSALYENDPDSLLRVSQIKFYSDGLIDNETAATIEPYPIDERLPFVVSEDHRGLNYFTETRLEKYITELEKVGFDMHIHAIGDRGVREALNAIESAINSNGDAVDRRHRITHLELVDPADYPRFAELDVIADFQTAGDFVLPAPGEGADGFVPVRSIYDTGARVTLSSDWDVSSLSPFVGIQNSLNRAEQSLPDVDSAVRAYTINAAYLMRSEDKTGSIEVNKFADLVVVDQNIFAIPTSRIGATKVLLTLLGGRVVYRAAPFSD